MISSLPHRKTGSGPAKRYLAADDDPILAAMAQQTLEVDGAYVRLAANGLEAWNALQEADFDLVLLDLEMPLLDGFDVLKQMRATERLSKLPVVVLTGRRDLWAIERAFELGATSFVTKPVIWPLLHHQVRFVLRSARTEEILEVVRSAVA